MSPKAFTAFRLDERLLTAMRQIKTRDGVPLTTQVEMAMYEWLAARGLDVRQKAERKQAATRKRS